ncbi:MAG: hypothetical protein IPG73_07340 [Ignavibacteria bacterium]|nr:hypothetical protein [Ignavibacteria bacterium]
MRLITTCFVLTMLSLFVAIAQTEYPTWIFGTSAGLTFNDGNGGILDRPRVVSSLPIDTREGSFGVYPSVYGFVDTLCNGETALHGTGRVLNGTQLSGGSSSSQGALWVMRSIPPLFCLSVHHTGYDRCGKHGVASLHAQ